MAKSLIKQLSKKFKLPKSKIVKTIIMATFLCSIIFMSVIYWSINNLPPELPLYYSLASGEEQLAQHKDILGITIVAGTLLLGNTIVGISLSNQWRILSRVMYVQNLLILALLTITLFQIGRLIT